MYFMSLKAEQVTLKNPFQKDNMVLWKDHRIWNQLTWNSGFISVNLVRMNYISQNFFPCMFPIRLSVDVLG